jgi:predicted Zn-dependent peptidase
VDYIQDYPSLVNGVTKDQVLAIIREYMDPSRMVHVRAGTIPKT